MEEEDDLDWLDETLASRSRKRKKKKNKNSNKTDVKRKKTEVLDDNLNKQYECDICSKRFPKEYYLMKHKRIHSTDVFKCELCPYVTNVKQRLNTHVKRSHERIRPVKCPHCYMGFQYQSQMEHHKLVHTGKKPYECEVCGKAFNRQYSLKMHSFIHTNEKPYRCKYCPYACRDTSSLRKHHNNHMGTTARAYQCNLCGLKLKCKSNLKMHVAEKHLNLDVKIHHCTLCDLRFKVKNALSRHIKSVHLKADFVHCDICSKRISQKSNLTAHMRSHDDYRQFECTFDGCHMRFKAKGDMKKHAVVHDAVKRFPCDICDRRFNRTTHLRAHLLKIHGPPRPRKNHRSSYQCNSCGYLSGSKPGLIVHMKQKEQKCAICNLTFCGVFRIQQHYQNMHADSAQASSDRDGDSALDVKLERDDTQSIDLFEIEKEEQLDDLFYAGSEAEADEASDYSEVDQEAMKRIEDAQLSVNLQDIPESVFDHFYSQHVDTVSDIPNVDTKDKIRAKNETKYDNIDPNIDLKVQSFIETPKLVNKRLEIVKTIDQNLFQQKNFDRLSNTASSDNINNENTAEKANKVITIETQLIENEEVQLNEDDTFREFNTTKNNAYQEISSIHEVDEVQEKEIRNYEEQINIKANYINEYNNLELAAKHLKQNKSEINETEPKLNENQNITPHGKSLDPELENISKEEFAEIVKLNVCNLKGIPDQLFDKFFIKHTDKVVREYKYTRHNTYEPNCEPTKAENKPQSTIKRHNNNTKNIKKNAIESNENEKKSTREVNDAKIQETNNKIKVNTAIKDIKHTEKQYVIELEDTDTETKSEINHNSAKHTEPHSVRKSCDENSGVDVVCNKKCEQKKDLTNDGNTKQNRKVIQKFDYKLESSKVKTLKTLSLIKVTNLMQISQYSQQTTYGTRRIRYNYTVLFKDTVSDDEATTFSERTAKDKSMQNKETINKNSKPKMSKKNKKKNGTTDTQTTDDTGDKPKNICIKRKVKKSKKRKPPKETYKSKCMPNSQQCYVCFELFNSKESLNDHSKKHFNVSNTKSMKKCPLCEYICRNGLPRHMRLVHNMEIANKYSMTNMKCKKDESGIDKYYIEGNNTDFNEIEVFPSVKNLNRTKLINIDKKNREENNKLLAKVKLVKKKDWIVEKEKLNVDMIVPNDNMKDKFTDDKDYMKKMRNLYQAAKKEGKVLMFPCRHCEKICQTLSALKLHYRKHDPNKKPYAPKVWKFRRTKSNREKTEIENNITEKSDTAIEDNGNSSVAATSKSTEKTEENSKSTTTVKGGRKKDKNPHDRDEKPKPIEHNHKCDPKLKTFYENCIRGSDIEFWHFLKIYNKMGRENVKDFADLDREDNAFGCHSLNEQDKCSVNQEQAKSTKSPKPVTNKNIQTKSKNIGTMKFNKSTHSKNQLNSNVATVTNKIPKTTTSKKGHATKINKGSFKSEKNYTRVVRISKKEYSKRQALKDMLRKKNAIN